MCHRLVQDTEYSNHKEIEMLEFNVRRLVDDCGGVREVAKIMGKTRTAPYRMMRTGYMGTNVLAKLLEAKPTININDYFERKHDRHTA